MVKLAKSLFGIARCLLRLVETTNNRPTPNPFKGRVSNVSICQRDACRIALGALPVQRLKACVNALTS
jgi:hypothetical protein